MQVSAEDRKGRGHMELVLQVVVNLQWVLGIEPSSSARSVQYS